EDLLVEVGEGDGDHLDLRTRGLLEVGRAPLQRFGDLRAGEGDDAERDAVEAGARRRGPSRRCAGSEQQPRACQQDQDPSKSSVSAHLLRSPFESKTSWAAGRPERRGARATIDRIFKRTSDVCQPPCSLPERQYLPIHPTFAGGCGLECLTISM